MIEQNLHAICIINNFSVDIEIQKTPYCIAKTELF